MKKINETTKNKLIVYLGAFLSQVSTLIAMVVIARLSDFEELAKLAIVDALILFLPLILSFMSERTAVILNYSSTYCTQNYFSSSFFFTIFTLPVYLFLYFVFFCINNEGILGDYDVLIMLAAFSISIYNISFQNYIIEKDYTGLAKFQIVRGLILLATVGVCLYIQINSVTALLIAYALSGVVASRKKIGVYLSSYSKDHILRNGREFLKIGLIPISVVIFSFIISNAGRFLLENNNMTRDLAELLVYSKNYLILMSVFMPLSNYFKPRLLEYYNKNRTQPPEVWNYLLIFSSLLSSLFILNFKYLWLIWGMDGNSLSLILLSIMVSGGIATWLSTSFVELYFEDYKLIKLKILIYALPASFLVVIFLVFQEVLGMFGVVVTVAISQNFILILCMFLAYGCKAKVSFLLYVFSVSYIILFSYLIELFSSFFSVGVAGYLFDFILSIAFILLILKCFVSSKLDVEMR